MEEEAPMTEQSTKPSTKQKEHPSDLTIYQGSYVSGQQPSAFTERQKQGTLALKNAGQSILSK
jgi:hypothetical protein